MASVRTFVAVHLDDPTRAALATASAELRRHAGALAVSWVAAENFHITLKFLGAVDAERIDVLVDALRGAVDGPRAFTLEIVGLGAFPSPTRPRVLWAGVGEGLEPLSLVADRVERAMSALGFAPEERGFSPHVTLGRVREPRRAPALAEAVAAAATQRFGRVAVEAIALMRSDLSPRGARYSALATLSLGG